jgi:hypothetical protein
MNCGEAALDKPLLLYLVSSILVKAICESQWIGRYSEKDSSDGRRDQLDPSVREANAEVQSGSYFGCIDRPDAFYRVVFHSVVAFFKIAVLSRHLGSSALYRDWRTHHERFMLNILPLVRGGQLLMSYTRRFETGAGNIEKLQQFLETKNLVGKIEKDFRQSRGAGSLGIVSVPTGWATLTVNTPASKLRKELISFFQKLENDDDSRL